MPGGRCGSNDLPDETTRWQRVNGGGGPFPPSQVVRRTTWGASEPRGGSETHKLYESSSRSPIYRPDISSTIPGVKAPGMLELPVLGLLKSRDMHGYELRKQLTAMLGPLWGVSWGSLYPTLRRLARAGAVVKLTDEAAPGSSRTNARRRTVYRITPHGEHLFALLL